MSHPATLDTPGHALRRVPTTEVAQPVTQARVIASEWLKFRTLRSTVAVLAAAVLGMLVLGLVIAYNTRHLAGLAPEDAAASGTLQGYYLGQLLIGALGVLFVTGEYSTGMIRSTLAAVPRRQPVLRAKLVVFTLVVATAMIAASFGAFLLAQEVLSHYRGGYSLTDPTALRVVIGTGVYLTLIGLLGGALGWIVRSTPGALVAVLGLILVVPVLFGELLGHWGKRVAEFLPTGAGASFSTTVREPETLAPWVGLAVMAAWVVVATVIASIVLQRRDA
jgi:ABC-2 type transport system permease protein